MIHGNLKPVTPGFAARRDSTTPHPPTKQGDGTRTNTSRTHTRPRTTQLDIMSVMRTTERRRYATSGLRAWSRCIGSGLGTPPPGSGLGQCLCKATHTKDQGPHTPQEPRFHAAHSGFGGRGACYGVTGVFGRVGGRAFRVMVMRFYFAGDL